ncbi:tetraspanin-9 isoform X4 [Zonotrichia albicollis]|uniref:tetraspanin-9 isoform X4 n=1 Tax=Zonotrichia albicollis TaxID=44394 RepID=UPI003D80FFA7
MLCPLVLSLLGEQTDPHLSTTPAATGEHSDTFSPSAGSQRSNTLAVMVGFGPASVSARCRRLQQRWGLHSGLGHQPCLPEPGGDSRPAAGPSGQGQLRGAVGAPRPGRRVPRGMLLAPTPGVSRRAPRAAEGAGRAPGRALPKGLRRAQDGAGGVRWRSGRAALPPTLHPSLPSSAGLEPPLGSAPSSSPLGNAGPSPSSRFRWQELGPCPALPPPLPQHSAPSGPAQGRAGLICGFFLGVHPVTSSGGTCSLQQSATCWPRGFDMLHAGQNAPLSSTWC